jgi:hypothetical protein
MSLGFVFHALDFAGAGATAQQRHDDSVEQLAALEGVDTVERWIVNDRPHVSVLTCDIAGNDVPPAISSAARSNSSGGAELLYFQGRRVWPAEISLPANSPGLSIAAMNVVPEMETEFLEWYDSEHLPQLAAVPGVLSARRFAATENSGRKYIAVYHVLGPEVTASAEWRACNATPWTQKMLPYFRDTLVLRCHRNPSAR